MKKYFKRLSPLLITVSVLLAFSFTSDASRTTYRSRGFYPPAVNFNATWPGLQTFTASGTWYRPPGVEFVLVIIAAGGGGGSGDRNENTGGGGSGGECKTEIVDVRSSSSETVTIGTGGAGGIGTNAAGSDGTSSSFGAHVTCIKGGGSSATVQEPSAGIGSGVGCNGYSGPTDGNGAYGLSGGNPGGGGGSYGAGGAPGNPGAAGTYGGGGGAGGLTGVRTGGAGGNGICIIIPIARLVTLP